MKIIRSEFAVLLLLFALGALAFAATYASVFLNSASFSSYIYACPFIVLTFGFVLFRVQASCVIAGAVAASLTLLVHYLAISSILLFSPRGDPNIGLGVFMYLLPLILFFTTWGGCHLGSKLYDKSV